VQRWFPTQFTNVAPACGFAPNRSGGAVSIGGPVYPQRRDLKRRPQTTGRGNTSEMTQLGAVGLRPCRLPS
jgi:hypothetical protein